MKEYDLIIIGGGPAGLTAAIYAKRSNLSVLVIEKEIAGGQIRTTSEIENWPGTIKSNGADLADSFKNHAESLETEFLATEVKSVKIEQKYKIIETGKESLKSKAVIIATGTKLNKLGAIGENEYIGLGVSYCAVCDGPFYKNENVAVVGGGNAALEEAMFLTNFANKVYLIHRRKEFRASPILVDRIHKNPKIIVLYDTTIEEILGENKGVNKIKIKDTLNNNISELDITGIFIFVGRSSQTNFLNNLIKLDKYGYIRINKNFETNQKGIFAAGDIRENSIRQVITAAGDGAHAALSAYHYLNNN